MVPSGRLTFTAEAILAIEASTNFGDVGEGGVVEFGPSIAVGSYRDFESIDWAFQVRGVRGDQVRQRGFQQRAAEIVRAGVAPRVGRGEVGNVLRFAPIRQLHPIGFAEGVFASVELA